MRDLMFACAMLLAVPLSFAKPVIAFYLWGWTALLIPTSYFYGFMAQARLNFTLAILTFLLIALRGVRWDSYRFNRVTFLYLLFLAHATIAFLLGYPNNPNNSHYYEVLLKLLAFCLLMPLFIDSRLRMHVMILVIVLGLGLHGMLDGLKTLASAGRHNIQGIAGSMLGDRNHLAVGLVVVLPLAYYLYQYSRNWLARFGFLGVFALLALAIMGSGSRGGFLSLAVVGLWLVMTARRKLLTLTIVAFLCIALLAYSPDQWGERISTIAEADADESFLGRVIAWKISLAIAFNNPFFGGGFHAVQVQEVWDAFKYSSDILPFFETPIPTFAAKAAHSIYFEVMGDLGLAGFAIYMVILLQAIVARFQIKRLASKLGSQYTWARDMADMLMLSILAYMVGGAAVSLGYFEPIYMIVMLVELIRVKLLQAASSSASGSNP